MRLSNAAYHQGPGVSSTDLKLLLKSPEHYAAAKLKPWKETPALRFGQQLHELFFEPELFEHHLIKPQALSDANCAKNPWKAEWDKLKELAELEKRQIIDFYDAQDMAGMVWKIQHSRIWEQQVSKANPVYELAFYHFDEELQVLTKCKVDILAWSMGLVLDLKSCENVVDFRWDAKKYLYKLSAAYYLRVVSNATKHAIDNFAWIPVEKEAPYGHKFMPASPQTLHEGRELAEKALRIYANCLATKTWAGYSDEWEEL